LRNCLLNTNFVLIILHSIIVGCVVHGLVEVEKINQEFLPNFKFGTFPAMVIFRAVRFFLVIFKVFRPAHDDDIVGSAFTLEFKEGISSFEIQTEFELLFFFDTELMGDGLYIPDVDRGLCFNNRVFLQWDPVSIDHNFFENALYKQGKR